MHSVCARAARGRHVHMDVCAMCMDVCAARGRHVHMDVCAMCMDVCAMCMDVCAARGRHVHMDVCALQPARQEAHGRAGLGGPAWHSSIL